MPAIQTIRKHGKLLIGIIGAALFAFIAEEAVRSMETTSNASKQQVGEVYGQTLNYQEFQEMVNNETEIMKLRTGQNLTDAMNEQVRDQVWQEFVQYQLIKHETDKLGLYVTDAEMQQALREGTAQSLQQILPMFVQNGRFDYTALQTFNKQYKEMAKTAQGEQMEQLELVHRLWQYAETKLRRELLANKYQALFMTTMLSNPVNAEMNFNDANTTTTAVVAALPYVAMTDKVEVTDAELKAAYDTYKENFRNLFELRDIKYIDVAVTASADDKKALDAEMNTIYDKLNAGDDPAAVIAGSKSVVRFADMPLNADAFPMDIRQQLDSMSVGQTKAPYLNAQDNTMNVVKLISKTATADSILYRALFVQGEDEAKAQTRYDSIMTALNGGANFKELAKKYGQAGDSVWVTSAQLSQGASQPDNVKFAKALYENNGLATIEINGVKGILQIMEKKGSSNKYVAAIAKCEVAFSKQTYNDAKNEMNLFMAQNKSLAEVEKAAAKKGYQLIDCPNFISSAHNIGAGNRSRGVAGTKDAVKWVFDEAKVGQMSKMYECGDANDHILIVGLAAVHEKGYIPWDDKNVKEFLTSVVTAQKKGELAAKKLGGVKTLEDAKKKGAVVDTLKNASFFQSPFIASTQAPEPKLAAALGAGKVGAVSAPVIGNAGAYLFQVVSHDKGEAKFDKKTAVLQDARQYSQMAQGFFYSLFEKAKVVDNRYKF